MFTQAILLSFALGSYAQSISSSAVLGSSSTTASSVDAQTTMNLFIDAGSDQQFIGEVLNADCDKTTYGLYCTEGDYGSGILSSTCDPDAIARATYGPGSFGLSTEAMTSGVRVTLVEECQLSGTTQAVCTASIGVSANGENTATSSTGTRTGTDVNYFQVPITAGASKLAACTGSDASSSGNAAPAATGAAEVWKVLVVPGAAALLGALA
ncbi:uncharacterized protein LTR77_000344 [Saxophila tyrrhenica]|uniref:Uncharacterized protein n=1 Tax=Saxophila tyrrhenica TaxID=1690608 RepID=A0AAV9PQK5_9PEZI|nr:hypothetical protein LTR77_000344 [Saxophila tyrrhenica]